MEKEIVEMKNKHDTITFELVGTFETLRVINSRIIRGEIDLMQIEDPGTPQKYNVPFGKPPDHEAWMSITCMKESYDDVIKKISEFIHDISEETTFLMRE